MRVRKKNARKTVLITGASSGIGMEFAKIFARTGYELVLTARREDRLEQLKKEVNVPCQIIVADLSEVSECYRLCEQLKDIKVDVFINNAGFGTCGRFGETDLEREISMLHVNVRAMHILLKSILLKMKKQGNGRILNVASSAGLMPAGPYMATYYATKSYVVSLTKAVALELKQEHSNIYVGALCPGPVETEFNAQADVVFSLRGISPKICVRKAIDGMRKRKVIIVPSAKMKLCVVGQKLLPDSLLLKLIARQQKKKTGSV